MLSRCCHAWLLSQRDDEIAPLFLLWPVSEVSLDPGHDCHELAVVERPDQDEACVVAQGFGPFACDWGEVAAVARDEHTLFDGGEFENERVVEPFEGRVGGQREDVVSCGLQRCGDAAGREVGVEEQPHRRLPRCQ